MEYIEYKFLNERLKIFSFSKIFQNIDFFFPKISFIKMQTEVINTEQIMNHKMYILPFIHTESDDTDSYVNDDNVEKKPTRKETYGKGNEAKVVREQIGDFDVVQSSAYKKVTQKFGRSIRLTEILGILNSIQNYMQIKHNSTLPQISRNEKRSFPLLIKYIESNKDLIFPYLDYISLCDSTFQKIPLDT